jgi:hypothetical protein
MFCKNCGHDLSGTARKFCPECGAAVGEAAPAPEQGAARSLNDYYKRLTEKVPILGRVLDPLIAFAKANRKAALVIAALVVIVLILAINAASGSDTSPPVQKQQCLACNGTGEVTCSRCGGSGQYETIYFNNAPMQCAYCTSENSPSYIGKRGKVKCYTCNGKGWVTPP